MADNPSSQKDLLLYVKDARCCGRFGSVFVLVDRLMTALQVEKADYHLYILQGITAAVSSL